MSETEQVEIASKGTSYTVVGGGDGGPWWVKYSMQAGFMFILILVLFGAYDLFKNKLPQLADPAEKIADAARDIENHTAESTEAQQTQAQAQQKIAEALTSSARAQEKQADAIERWVNQQGFQASRYKTYGPPAEKESN